MATIPATIRTMTAAGAALVALMAIAPAQAQRAPLQLVPQTDEVRMTAGTVPARKATKTRRAAKPKGVRNSRAAKTPQSGVRRTARNAKKVRNTASNRRLERAAPTAQRTRAAARKRMQAHAVAPSPVPPEIAEPVEMAAEMPADNVIRGPDTISLIARLPWWRNDRMQPIRYGSPEAESKVLAAADAWLDLNPSTKHPDDTFASAAADEVGSVVVADSGLPNEIDLAANSVPLPPSPTFLQSLIALIGGATAAAASARFLFV